MAVWGDAVVNVRGLLLFGAGAIAIALAASAGDWLGAAVVEMLRRFW